MDLAHIPTPLTGKSADQVDGVDLPNTIANVLTDHTKAVHNALGLGNINRLKGITPTFAIFDTNPSNPQNMTDEDFTTESGEGVKTLSAPAAIGYIEFNMGAAYPVLIVAHINAHRASGDGTISLEIYVGDDGVNWFRSGLLSLSGRSADSYYPMAPLFFYAQYIRLRFDAVGTTVASVYHVKVAEAMALQFLV